MTPQHAGRVDSLDTLRGVAILVVIAFHVSKFFQPASWIMQAANFGNQGVQLFFLISAVTMCLMWDQRATEPRRPTKFYIRRFFRIAPLFWLAIVFYTFWDSVKLGIPMRDVFTAKEILLTLTFLHAFSPDAINLVVPGGWSIAVEMNFYVVFPLLVLGAVTPRRMLLLAFASYVVLGIVATTVIERLYDPPPIFLYYSLLTEFPIFPLGIFIYLSAMKGEKTDVAGTLALLAGWLALAFGCKYAYPANGRPFFWVEMALLGGMLFTFIRRGWYLRPLSFVGGLSYSMYLSHFVVIDGLAMLVPAAERNGNLRYALALAAVTAVTVAAGKLSSLTFEAWSSTLGRRVLKLVR